MEGKISLKHILPVLILCVLALTACAARPKTPWVPDKPEDTALEFWITEDVGEADFSGLEEEEGWYGADVYYGTGYHALWNEEFGRTRPERCVIYTVTAYPDYADGGQYVTRIEITDPEITLYGLTLDSSPEEFNAVFEPMGLTLSTGDEWGQTLYFAQKDNIIFILDPGNSLSIKAEVSNRENICF